MGAITTWPRIVFLIFIALSAFYFHQSSADGIEADQPVALYVNASEKSAKKIPKTLFGIFFEVSLISTLEVFYLQLSHQHQSHLASEEYLSHSNCFLNLVFQLKSRKYIFFIKTTHEALAMLPIILS